MITLSPDIERLARRVAEQRGSTPEEAIRAALESEARSTGIPPVESPRPRRPIDLERARAIIRRIASRPLLDPRPARDILDEAWSRNG